MGTLHFLASVRLEQHYRTVRRQLSELRRRKLIFSTDNAQPARNPALDPMLLDLQHERLRLDEQIRKLEPGQLREPVAAQLDSARKIQLDTREIVDLLIWFGAEMPLDLDAIKNSLRRMPDPGECPNLS